MDTATATAISTNVFQVGAIYWDAGGSAASADTVSVQDSDGNVKWTATVAQADESPPPLTLPTDAPLTFNGLKVPTLANGTVYLYIRKILK